MFRKLGYFFDSITPGISIGVQVGFVALLYYLIPLTIQTMHSGLAAIIGAIFLVPITFAIGTSTLLMVITQTIKSFISRKWWLILIQLLILTAVVVLAVVSF